MKFRFAIAGSALLAIALIYGSASSPVSAQSKKGKAATPAARSGAAAEAR